jgi:hypothetical protein
VGLLEGRALAAADILNVVGFLAFQPRQHRGRARGSHDPVDSRSLAGADFVENGLVKHGVIL